MSGLGCRILTSRDVAFNKLDVECRMSDGTYKLPYATYDLLLMSTATYDLLLMSTAACDLSFLENVCYAKSE